MSVALQGDWGTGKTSFINRMSAKLTNSDKGKQSKIKTIYFNTWQYSQFNSPQDLYTSFAICLIDKLSKQTKTHKPGEISETAKKVLSFLVTAGLDVGRQVIDNKIGVDLNRIQDGAEKILDSITIKNKQITDLKENFSKLISEAAGEDGRIIIFIDDLDRLNPEVAVALLETIKLFMDVEQCIFVLAIDYDVVVRGIRKKYGSDMDDAKCRSFFDKIIQLPFRMPTEKYIINTMLENTSIGSKIEGYTDIISNLIKDTLGPNPRTLKRLINAFELLILVEKEKTRKEKYLNALLLVSLILQIYDEREYAELLDSVSDIEVFKLYKDNKKLQDEDDGRRSDNTRDIIPFFTAIDKIGKQCGEPIEKIENDFINILSLSAMTTIKTESVSASGGKEHKVDKIILYGDEKRVDTPTAAIRETVTRLLLVHSDKLDYILEKYNKTFTTDAGEERSMFAAKNDLDINGRIIYLAIKTSYDQKLKLARKLCIDLGEQNNVQWLNGTEELLWEK